LIPPYLAARTNNVDKYLQFLVPLSSDKFRIIISDFEISSERFEINLPCRSALYLYSSLSSCLPSKHRCVFRQLISEIHTMCLAQNK
jgi:hypothetical protein